ncbi:MAG: succinate dehydrogenase [Alphaproteobacteria bacterium]|nr:succinate dehydrogenase [Alphaproteobacteria bacterium]
MSLRLYVLQRGSALILAPLVLAHLVVIFYATAQGLSAASILGRTKGSLGWGVFYGVFVLAAAVHGAIGIHNVLAEWGPDPLKRNSGVLSVTLWVTGIGLAVLGLRAVYAVVAT